MAYKSKTESEWAVRNLELAGWFKKDGMYDGMIGDAVKRLLEVHSKEGHSGMSNGLAAGIFKEVATGTCITVEYWNERYLDFNEFLKERGEPVLTKERYAEINKKPKEKEEKSGD